MEFHKKTTLMMPAFWAIVITLLVSSPALGAHSSTVELYPEWSPANADVDYTVEFCKTSGDTVNELRIYKNYDGSSYYTNFYCDERPGWELLYISTYPACFYIANDSSPDYNPLDSDGECVNFTFHAHSPGPGPDYCDLTWRFETRDVVDYWQYLYDNTSVDDKPPVIVSKEINGPQWGDCPPETGETCWVDTSTSITVTVTDEGDCAISGLDYCKIYYSLDGGANQTIIEETGLNGATSWTHAFSFPEDSNHTLYVECRDIAGNLLVDEEFFRVDSQAPETTKKYGIPFVDKNGVHWITNSTPISFTVEDQGDKCAVGVDKTWYVVVPMGDECTDDCVACDTFACELCGNTVTTIEWCQDECSQYEHGTDPWYDCVEDCVYYCCDGTDHNDCAPGVSSCNIYCEYGCNKYPWILYRGGTFTIPEDSCHVIEFQSVDYLGNYEDVQSQCVYVDNQPPEGEKTIGGPHLSCQEGEDCDYWVTQDTSITLECTDPLPHPVGGEKVCYKIEVDGNDATGQYCDTGLTDGWCCVSKSATMSFTEDSNHTLSYYCEDALGNKNTIDTEEFRVDSLPPVMTKSMYEGTWTGSCPPGAGEACWVTPGTSVTVSMGDNTSQGCAVDDVVCTWTVYVDGQEQDSGKEWEPSFIVSLEGETNHTLEVECCDALNNCETDVENFLVDGTPPETTKEYGKPIKVDPDCETSCNGDEACIHERCTIWVTDETSVSLSAVDSPGEPCASGVNATYYRVEVLDNDEACLDPLTYCNPLHSPGGEGWNEYNGPFTLENESCHVIEYYSVDDLGNTETVRAQCVFVDLTPPVSVKQVGEPKQECSDDQGCDYWVTRDTSITLDCQDQEPHPVGQETLCYRVSLDDNSMKYTTQEYCEHEIGTPDAWCCVDVGGDDPEDSVVLSFKEDSNHNLEYYCMDHLGNDERDANNGSYHVQWYKVDTIPPETTKTYEGPFYVDGNGWEYMDTATRVNLSAVDGGDVCAIGVDKTYYSVYLVDDEYCRNEAMCESYTPCGGFEFHEYDGTPFPIDEQSCHLVAYYSVDELGNEEPVKHQCVFVDKKPPETSLEISGPAVFTLSSVWVGPYTSLSLSAIDPLPHPSGVNRTYYKVTWLENPDDWHYCYSDCDSWANDSRFNQPEGWTEWNGEPFSLEQESCHVIEYYSVDNVGKTENVSWDCVFMDETPPTPNKTVGDPKTEWDGRDAIYYNIADKCWNESSPDYMECWKITLLTPISLECIDQGDHPVGEARVCFRVELDGDDATREYCDEYYGVFNESGDGYCCLPETLPRFYFGEETEHELDYYCIDALGNRGDKIDREKFKVEGTSFDITLNKKWNLISVPFVMLDNSIDEAFSGIADRVESVWTYDAVTGSWSVYTPGPAPDNLTTMEPGWGYWVLMREPAVLTIGGSLFTPARTPPERSLAPGWNLIGYYGTEGMPGYYGPYENGKPVYCALYSLIDTMVGHPRWSALVTYWEPYNPHQWVYLESEDHMDPGAGYWIEMDVADLYTFTTECGYW